MGEALVARYWCHMCSQMVNPVMDVDIKCPYCDSGFVEEMDERGDLDASDLGSDRAVSLWAPILLGIMGRPLRRQRFRREEEDGETDPEHDFVSILRRRRRSSGILQLLQTLQDGIRSEADNPETERDRERDGDNNRMILINPLNQAVTLQRTFDTNQRQNGNSNSLHLVLRHLAENDSFRGLDLVLRQLADNDPQRTFDTNQRQNENSNYSTGIGTSFPDLDLVLRQLADNDPQRTFDTNQRQNENSNYSTGIGTSFPDLDLVLRQLAESDPRRGTPPARKEAVDAMPTVKIKEHMSCSVCLEDFDIGTEVREIPCKHKFHNGCILPWLELHSSCPVCRFQMPVEGSKDSNGGSDGNRVEGSSGGGGNGRRFWVPIPWPFNGLFSLSGSSGSSSSAPPSSSPSGSDAHGDES